MIERYYTIVETAALLRIHPEYARALLARLPKVSPPAYRRFGSHPRRVRVLPERDVRLLQSALIRVIRIKSPRRQEADRRRETPKNENRRRPA